MTPIEAAVKAAHDRGFTGVHRDEIEATDARAIVSAFLDAALASQSVKDAIHYQVSQAAGVVQPSEPPLPMWFCTATIMSLKDVAR